MPRSLLILVLLAGALRAQVELGPLLPLLENLDRDEAREVAARYLVSMPESPATALRTWAAGGGWRRQSLLLRVLGERGELTESEIASGLASGSWPVVVAACRALPLSPPSLDVAKLSLRPLLGHSFYAVRREALLAMARADLLEDRDLLGALSDQKCRSIASSIYLSRPARYQILNSLLEDARLDIPVLLRLPGLALGAGRKVLVDYAARRGSPGRRCLALRALPRRLWPVDPVPLVLAGLEESGYARDGALNLAEELPARDRERFLDGILEEKDPERFRERLELAGRIPQERGEKLLEAHHLLETELLGELLRELKRSGLPGLAGQALRALTSGRSDPRLLPWVQQIGPLVRTERRLVPALLGFLEGDGALADAAFRVLAGAEIADPRLASFAVRDPRNAARRVKRILSLAERMPEEFWLSLLGSENRRLRWSGAKALASRAQKPELNTALLKSWLNDEDPSVRLAALSSLLDGLARPALGALLARVLELGDPAADRVLIRHLERSEQAWVPAALEKLRGTRLEDEGLVLAAMRGDQNAARALLARLGKLSGSQLERLRKAMPPTLTLEDVPFLRERLTGEKKAAPWLRAHLVSWLRARRDLPAGELLASAHREESDPELRPLLAAALVERGRTEHLLPLLEGWARTSNEEAEGILLEAIEGLGKLEHLGPEQARLLVRLLAAPALRDPLAQIELEWRKDTPRGRTEVLYPLLRATVQGLMRLEPARFRRILVDELGDRRTHRAWSTVSKSYLCRGLLIAAEHEGGMERLRPLLAWAHRLGPKPHEADGPLLLIEALLAEKDGRLEEAARYFRRGLCELSLAELTDRSVERLAQNLLVGNHGRRSLEARACLLEARVLLQRGMAADTLLERARIAGRGDAAVLGRIRALESGKKSFPGPKRHR